MHLGARGFVHAELIEPETGAALAMDDGATGELVLTHLQHRAAPLLRFRTRDHVEVRTSPCSCGRTAPRLRCIGRTDDMLIVRGVNVFPSAVREVVSAFAPAGQRPDPRQAAGARASSRSRRCPSASSSRGARRRTRPRGRDPRADARAFSSSRHAWSSCRGGACAAASTSRSSSSVGLDDQRPGGSHGHKHAEHPEAERQQPDRSHLRSGRRARIRRAGHLGEEGHAGVLREGPGRPHAAARGGGTAQGLALGELRDHAVPLQQARSRPVLSEGPGRAGDDRQRDVLPDRHALSARRAGHLSDARLPAVRGRGGHLRRRRRHEGTGAEGRRGRARRAARRLPRVLPRRKAVHRRRPPPRSPTSAWRRRSSSCTRSTTSSRPGPRSTWPRWRPPWARPTRSRRPTCAASSPP